jgi:DNA polymerase-1
MLLQVHDELVFETPAKEAKLLAELASSVMSRAAMPAVEMKVPLVVEAKFANSWAEAH